MLHYTYTATGQKISQQLEDEDKLGTRRDYAGPFVYVNNTLGWINTIYGRIVAVPKGGLRKELHLRDHLGNTRMVLEEGDRNYEVVQEAAYYPFGMAIPSQSFALPNENDTYQNRYLYNGKEYQDDFGLNWYDYGARFYDAQIARFTTVDPLAEKFGFQSPYVYAANNPIRFIDFMGMSSEEPDPGAEKSAEDDEETRRQEEQAAQEAARQAEQDALIAAFQQALSDLYENSESGTTYYLAETNQSDSEESRNNSGMSISTFGQFSFKIGVGLFGEAFNLINNEYIRQVNLNNSLRKPGVSPDPLVSLKVPKGLRFLGEFGGTVFNVFEYYNIERQYKRGEITKEWAIIEHNSNAIGAIPGVGTAWTLGWEAGRALVSIPAYRNYIRDPLRKVVGVDAGN